MIRTVEALIDPKGNVRLLESVERPASGRVWVTILDDEPLAPSHGTALMSEPALEDWNRPEEEAWSHLQGLRGPGGLFTRAPVAQDTGGQTPRALPLEWSTF
jgi:hypothetical protein